ncbi:helix-turn-helix domain-containing protein [Actinoplanes sp. TRM 88003]|uniref:Helix-turn-helix domain-containing protein n=1 Tax=Paractinoplanes aksuensis TaxID=2939490 RepID=A0ABT1E446_9ACTN|nr:helix-turn-helix transcriptional regulator [Actinoplanes aksuensis]MCO8277770.1 helix-turn-helix domain-containing protein [Actinoplanes aksuensis]
MSQDAFGATLRRARQDAGLTIAELAAASGISPRAISDMERGHSRAPRRSTVAALAAVLPTWQSQPEQDVGGFAGRDGELARLRGVAGDAPVMVICGTAGVGKTALALAFAGAPLILPFRSSMAEPADPVPSALPALGVPAAEVPSGAEDRAALFRARLERRTGVTILDDVANEAQIRPLLPASGPSFTIVTSRRLLTGLEGVHRLHLNALPPPEAVAALTAMLPGGFPEAEIAEAARECHGVPLLLRAAADRLTAQTERAPGQLAAEALGPSYARLSPSAAQVFLSLTSVITSRPDAEDALDELVETSFLEVAADGSHHLPPLSRLFQAQLLAG